MELSREELLKAIKSDISSMSVEDRKKVETFIAELIAKRTNPAKTT